MTRTAADIRAEIYGIPPYSVKLKHGPNQSGEGGPCEPDCRKCALEAMLADIAAYDATVIRNQPAQAGSDHTCTFTSVKHTSAMVDRAIVDQVAIGAMSAAYGERRCPPTEGRRRVWARELRRRVQESETRERNRVLVDRDFEDWE